MKLQRIDIPHGAAWQPADITVPAPRIFGDISRDYSECTGILIGVSAQQASPRSNAWHVVPEADAVPVARLPGEALYDGAAPSLIQRVAELHGTGKGWALVYSET